MPPCLMVCNALLDTDYSFGMASIFVQMCDCKQRQKHGICNEQNSVYNEGLAGALMQPAVLHNGSTFPCIGLACLFQVAVLTVCETTDNPRAAHVSFESATKLYEADLVSRMHSLGIIAAIIAFAKIERSFCSQFIEVGSGTGGTTSFVLPALSL